MSTVVTQGGPCMILHSQTQLAYRNKGDESSDRGPASGIDPRATIDLHGNNVEGEATVPGEVVPATTYNNRNHRLDTFSFFSRQRLARQTGGTGTFDTVAARNGPLVAPMTSDEAWIWYGHLWLPNNNGVWPVPAAGAMSDTFPGQQNAATNQNNYYASQWILGRVAILLRQPLSTTLGGDQLFDKSKPNPKLQNFFCYESALPMSPLQAGSQDASGVSGGARVPGNNPVSHLEESRYDLAGINIQTFGDHLSDWIADPVNAGADWWDRMMCANTINAGSLRGGRFQSMPYLGAPMDSAKLAKMSPIFINGCTQFIVEYAGDFIAQNAAGEATSAYMTTTGAPNPGGTDGVIDYILDPVTQTRKIRWYGFPRNTDDFDGAAITGWSGAITSVNQIRDVVPLRDVLRTISGYNAVTAATFEKFGSSAPNTSLGVHANYADGSVLYTDDYTCAWGKSVIPGPNPPQLFEDPKPKMIRIIVTLDDPAGKLADGQTFEYVFTLP
jgi:hypothetical protein